MSMIVSPERNALSSLARQYPELAARPPASATRFTLNDGQKIRYLGGRSDLCSTVEEVVAFGLPLGQEGELAKNGTVKPKIDARSTYFFLFRGKARGVEVELLELDAKKSRGKKLVFRPTGHKTTFTDNII